MALKSPKERKQSPSILSFLLSHQLTSRCACPGIFSDHRHPCGSSFGVDEHHGSWVFGYDQKSTEMLRCTCNLNQSPQIQQ